MASAYPVLCSDTNALEEVLSYYQPLNNQGDFGTCWAQTIGAVAELSSARASRFTDLSEFALAYGIYKNTDNPVVGNDAALGSVSFDGNDIAMLNRGGNLYLAGQYLAKGIQFQTEKNYPYITSDTDARFDNNGNLNIDVNSFYHNAKIRTTNVSEININTDEAQD